MKVLVDAGVLQAVKNALQRDFEERGWQARKELLDELNATAVAVNDDYLLMTEKDISFLAARMRRLCAFAGYQPDGRSEKETAALAGVHIGCVLRLLEKERNLHQSQAQPRRSAQITAIELDNPEDML